MWLAHESHQDCEERAPKIGAICFREPDETPYEPSTRLLSAPNDSPATRTNQLC